MIKQDLGEQTMIKIYSTLKTILWSFIGVFIGSSIYQYYDYKSHTALYEMQSAPWYLAIEIRGIFNAVIVAIILAAMWIIKKKIND